MDMLNLLEVLKPANHIVTIQMASNYNFWDSTSKFLIAILPALISFIALLFSYFQFKANIQNQSEQYTLGIEQQLKTLKLNTRLATEIELKKDICKEVRVAYVAFMKNHSLLYAAKQDFKSLENREDAEGNAKRAKAHEVVMERGQLCIESKILIDSYLDLNDPHDYEFFKSLIDVSSKAFLAECNGADFGKAQGKCGGICFEFIKRRSKEITGLVDTIGN